MSEKIAKAQRVMRLLEDQEFKNAIETIQEKNFIRWRSCATTDDETQLDCKYIDYAINELLKQFKRVIEDGKIEEAQLEQDKKLAKRKRGR